MNKNINNSTSENKSVSAVAVVALLILVAITYFLIYELNKFYPIFADDFPFSMVYGTTDKLNNISQLIKSQYLFFIDHSGRTIEHSIAQILLMLGTPWLDILHTLAFIFLCLIIYAIANFKKQTNPYLFLLIVLSMWFFQPAFAVTVLNITSGSVYMWGTLINLIFIYPYYKYYISDVNQNNYYRAFFFFGLGIVAGWTQENMAPSMILIASAFTFLRFHKTKKIESWCITGIIGEIIGCALLIGAPGNYIRLNADTAALSTPTIPFYINGMYNIIGGYLNHAAIISIIYLIAISIYHFLPNKKRQHNVLLTSILFFTTSLVATILMIASPIFPARAWFGIIVLMIIAIAILYANISFEKKYLKVLNWVVLIGLSIIFFKQYKEAYIDLKQINETFSNIEKSIETQKAQGIKDIVLTSKIQPRTDFSNISDVMADTTHWLYPVILGYYQINSITREEMILDKKSVKNETK